LPTLNRLTICFFREFPIHVLQPCSQLVALKLAVVTFSTYSDNIAPPHEQPAHQGYLQSLTLNAISTTIEPLLNTLQDASSSLSLSRLRTFSSTIEDEINFADCLAVLALTGSYLEKLEITINIDFPLVFPRLALPRLEKLEFKPLGSLAHFTNVLSMLKSFPDAPQLSQVSILVHVSLCVQGNPRGYRTTVWRQIDEVLTGGRYATCMQLVAIAISANISAEETMVSRDFFAATTPRLLAKGYLAVDTVTYSGGLRRYNPVIPNSRLVR